MHTLWFPAYSHFPIEQDTGSSDEPRNIYGLICQDKNYKYIYISGPLDIIIIVIY